METMTLKNDWPAPRTVKGKGKVPPGGVVKDVPAKVGRQLVRCPGWKDVTPKPKQFTKPPAIDKTEPAETEG